ncbi:UNVERIFIED_CONTAM: hypothetical protein K2H54_014671 [Gekko kuhli]
MAPGIFGHCVTACWTRWGIGLIQHRLPLCSYDSSMAKRYAISCTWRNLTHGNQYETQPGRGMVSGAQETSDRPEKASWEEQGPEHKDSEGHNRQQWKPEGRELGRRRTHKRE